MAALLVAFLFSFILSRGLNKLALGMDRVAQLTFDEFTKAMILKKSPLKEIARCEYSFLAMTR